jgi:dTDP-6-deoxy-L-talose 4-dehydrogenase (NAD+)
VKILITGGNGYIGRHITHEAILAGHEVVVSDFNTKNIPESAQILDVDIFSGNRDIFQEVGAPDLLIHLAWEDGFVHNSEKHILNISKHARFLNDMIAGGLQKIAVMGTMHEVGYFEGAIDENTPCNPLSQYGVAKNALRQSLLLNTKNTDISVYWLRAFYIFGDDLFGSSIFAKIAIAANNGQKEFPFTTGRNKYDFISVQDLAKQIIAAVEQDEITGIINVCSGKPVALAEQVEWYIKSHGYDISLIYGAFAQREYDSAAVWGDDTKIQQIMQRRR